MMTKTKNEIKHLVKSVLRGHHLDKEKMVFNTYKILYATGQEKGDCMGRFDYTRNQNLPPKLFTSVP